jgi:hypothetical protein
MAPFKLLVNFQLKLFFFGQGQGNNLASSSTHSLLELLIVFKACNFNAHDFLKGLMTRFVSFRIPRLPSFLRQNQFWGKIQWYHKLDT